MDNGIFKHVVIVMIFMHCGGFDEKLYNLACYNCGDFHALWWVLNNNDIFLHVHIVVICMHCGGF